MGVYGDLQETIKGLLYDAYDATSMLNLFNAVPVGGVGKTKWTQTVIKGIGEAALTEAGFNPSEATLVLDEMSNRIMTASQRMKFNQIQWAQIVENGLDENAILQMGEKVGKQASYYLWRGQNTSGNSPYGEYNFLNDAGTGNGSLERPLINTSASAGPWDVYINKAKDLSELIAPLIKLGSKRETIAIFYPVVATSTMRVKGNATNDLSAIEYLIQNEGINPNLIFETPDNYLYTAAGVTPTKEAFDIYAVDMAKVDVGYTVPLENDVDVRKRTTIIESEVWFTPMKQPILDNDAGKIYCGVSRKTAIDEST